MGQNTAARAFKFPPFRHPVITGEWDSSVVDIPRLSDIFRRNGNFSDTYRGDGYADFLAEQFIRLGREFVAATQTIYDPHYKSEHAYQRGRMRGASISIASLCANAFGEILPAAVIMPMDAAADLDGSAQSALDMARAFPRRGNFRMHLMTEPYEPAIEVLQTGGIDAVRERMTAFPFKRMTFTV